MPEIPGQLEPAAPHRFHPQQEGPLKMMKMKGTFKANEAMIKVKKIHSTQKKYWGELVYKIER